MQLTEEKFSTEFLLNSLDPNLIYLQLNYHDYYMTKPSSLLDTNYSKSLPLNKFEHVPTIRVFGCLPSGHRVLCHIHGIFPYIFIPYDGKIEYDSSTLRYQKCVHLHILLESKLQNTPIQSDFIFNGNLNYIADVSLVKAIPFYGYHIGWSAFYKISLLNPSYVKKLSNMLRNGTILNKPVETFESNIPYLLQFVADFNLFGCSWIKLTECYFRSPILNPILDIDRLMLNSELKEFLIKFCRRSNHTNNGNTNILPRSSFQRIGNSLLEIDILPQFIQNRQELQFKELHHDFIEYLNNNTDAPKSDHYITSTKQMVKDLMEQRHTFGLGIYKKSADVNRSSPDSYPKWQRAKENQSMYDKVRKSTRIHFASGKPTFDNFIHLNKNFESVKKIEDSIANLWPVYPDFSKIPQYDVTKEVSSNENNILIQKTEANSIIDESINNQEINFDIDSDFEKNNMDDDKEVAQTESVFLPSLNSPTLQPEEIKAIPKYSLDMGLTQTMMKRRNQQSQSSNNITFSFSNLQKSQDTYFKKPKTIIKLRNCSISNGENYFVYTEPNITYRSILHDLEDLGYPKVNYKDPFFSNPLDIKNKLFVYAGKRFEINSSHLSDRIPIKFQENNVILETRIRKKTFSTWRYIKQPPIYKEIASFCNTSPTSTKIVAKKKFPSQIDMTMLHKNAFLYKYSSGDSLEKKSTTTHNHLTHLSLEIHVNTRANKYPDPLLDEVVMIFWVLESDTYPFDLDMEHRGILVVNKDINNKKFINKIECAASPITIKFYATEFEMFDALTNLILLFDPDILSGYEVHMSSWGYIIDRCTLIHKFDIVEEISRVNNKYQNKSKDTWGYLRTSGFSITGRYILNIWRIMRASFNLTQYSIENTTYHILHLRLPHFSYSFLTSLWSPNSSITQLKTVISYWMKRVELNILLLQKDDFIARTTEFSRLLGIDFNSVFHRGSQYKVESILLRICKSESFLLNSPSKQDVKRQKPLECVPLVMEPQSAFYKSPLVVLDFQSLYPSIIIAYNYCYSTMIGRVDTLNLNSNEIGTTQIPLRENLLELLKDYITISPNGIVFVKKAVRKSTLAKMLMEILDLRVMVKKTIAELPPENESLKKQLNNKQLALKLLANVTYGFASASFSGRMPCSDLADAIVQTGRETLEHAINIIEQNAEWGAKVVYGDTDSLFVYLPGKTKDDAFRIGNEISIKVSESNPKPIFLKFEKVYFPSILLSKKRYVGYSYESISQTEASFDSKGIETVRRDGHPAQQKIVEKAIRLLFDTSDITLVKDYVQQQFSKLYEGKVSVQEFCFAKEVKLGTYKSDSTAPVGALVAKKQMEDDHRTEPQYKERVPYLVVKGRSGEILRNRGVSPKDFFTNTDLALDADYYIDKTLIPPLSRLFNIMGINVEEWKSGLTRYTSKEGLRTTKDNKKVDKSQQCSNCGYGLIISDDSMLCQLCFENKKTTSTNLMMTRISREQEFYNISTVCRTCTYKYTKNAHIEGHYISEGCESYDCPVYYSRIKIKGYLTDKKSSRRSHSLKFLDEW